MNERDEIVEEFFKRMFGHWNGHSEQLRGFIKLIVSRAIEQLDIEKSNKNK